jgi:hypothetical protein
VRSIFRSRLGAIIATGALTGGALVALAVPASATTEVTKCVNIDFSGNTTSGAASVTVIRQNISAECPNAVPVRAWTKCKFTASATTIPLIWWYNFYTGPSVTSGISRVGGCVGTSTQEDPNNGTWISGISSLNSFGWQYYKNGTWYNGSAGALT